MLYEFLARIAREMGFDYFALAEHIDLRMPQQQPLQIHNYPRGWAAYYVERDLGPRDPIRRASHRTHLGFAWLTIPRFLTLTPADRAVLAAGHPHDEAVELAGDETPLPTRPTRAKLSAPQFEQQHELGKLDRPDGSGFAAWASKQTLMVTNLGVRKPGATETGFLYCPACGRTEPTDGRRGSSPAASRISGPIPTMASSPNCATVAVARSCSVMSS